MNDFQEWMSLVSRAQAYFDNAQEKLSKDYQLSKQETYQLDYQKALITFFNDSQPSIVAHFIVIGSVSFSDGTWLWSWANPYVDSLVKEEMNQVKAFGDEHEMSPLTNNEFAADQNDGWLMAAISSYILNADGVWLAPFEGGATYLALKDIRRLNQVK